MNRLRDVHPAAWVTAAGGVLFTAVFGALGVRNHAHFGTWSYDMGIYDQAFWLVSRGGNTFMSVRGLDVWGHHVNLVAFAFAPFYWLGAGPSFLYVVQAAALGAGAVPVYLIARDRLGSPWFGACLAWVYLLYAPTQWISWAMFHPEALVITPLLFAWWFALQERWRWTTAMVLVALSMREDAALAVMMLAVVLAVVHRRGADTRRAWTWCGALFALGAVWYLVATKLVIPHFNDGEPPFYVTFFYRDYGGSSGAVVRTVVLHPGRVLRDATRHDRLHFYWQLGWPMGWTFLANPLALLVAAPQMLASVIGSSPYARMIRYQYTAVMVAPIVVASIEGVRTLSRLRWARVVLPVWLIGCALVTNVMWSPSPLDRSEAYVWASAKPRDHSLRAALAAVPGGASVSATYRLLPHLSHRRHVYDWPNPFVASVWGNLDSCAHLPDPRTVDYVVLDKQDLGQRDAALYLAMRELGGPFEVVFEDDEAITMHRVGTSDRVDVQPQRDSCRAAALPAAVPSGG